MSNAAMENVRKQLDELEQKAAEFKSLGVEEEALKKKMSGLKAQLVALKEKYDPIAGEYAEVMLEASEIHERRRSLDRDMDQEHPPQEWIVPEYGYYGNLNRDNKGRVIHESACPATTGEELWGLMAARRVQGKK